MLSALAKRLDFNHNEDAWPRVCTCVRICEILLCVFIHIHLFVCMYVCMYVCVQGQSQQILLLKRRGKRQE